MQQVDKTDPEKNAVDRVLDVMGNCEWHDLKAVRRRAGLQKGQLTRILEFFAKYDLAEIDSLYGKARLDKEFMEAMTPEDVTVMLPKKPKKQEEGR